MGRTGKPKASALALAAALLIVVLATTASNAGGGPPRCGGKPADIVGTGGDNDLFGTDNADVIVGRGGDDRIDSGKGRDRVCGNGGNDLVSGGEGADPFVSGGKRKDGVYGSGPGSAPVDGDDKVLGGRGNDNGRLPFRGGTIPGVAGVYGGRGDDLVNGGRGRDLCEGGFGHDQKRNCELPRQPSALEAAGLKE